MATTLSPRAATPFDDVLRPRVSIPGDDAATILRRNSTASIWYRVDDGGIRSLRERYATASDVLYLPAWTGAVAFRSDAPVDVEAAVSEIEGLASWRVVWVRGTAMSLRPTGGAEERREWRVALAHLRRVMPGLGADEELMLHSYSVVRLDIRELAGSSVQMD